MTKAAPKPNKRDIIRTLNDQFRTTLIGGDVMLTQGINELPASIRGAIINKVMTYSAFNKSNDPHNEHDFGSFAHNGEKVFFKMDYYDHSLQYGSPDPSDASLTRRVLTIMLADEY